MTEYITPHIIYTPGSAYARVAASTRPDLMPTWSQPVPFDNEDPGPLRGQGAAPGNVLVEFEPLITLPEDADCWAETTKEVYLYSRRPLVVEDVSAPDGWTVTAVPPWGGSPPTRGGHGLLVLTAPEGFAGRSLRFTCTKPLERVLGIHTVRDREGIDGSDVFLADDAGNRLLLDDGNLMQDAYE